MGFRPNMGQRWKVNGFLFGPESVCAPTSALFFVLKAVVWRSQAAAYVVTQCPWEGNG